MEYDRETLLLFAEIEVVIFGTRNPAHEAHRFKDLDTFGDKAMRSFNI